MAEAFVFCLENENIDGAVNVTAPEPLQQKEFSRQLVITSENMIKLNFVNHKYSGKSTDTYTEDKPRVIINNGDFV